MFALKFSSKIIFNSICLFQVVNKHLLKDLTERGLWDDDMKNKLIASNGSVQVRN